MALVQSDMAALHQSPEEFGLFLSFSYEVFDTYGRFLAFLNRNQPEADVNNPRPLSYNERMLEAGACLPYFIWPNIAPFRDADTVMDSIVPVGGAADMAQASPSLRRARNFVKSARAQGLGVFDPLDPLQFEAFGPPLPGPPPLSILERGAARGRILAPTLANWVTTTSSYARRTLLIHPDRLFIPLRLLACCSRLARAPGPTAVARPSHSRADSSE